MSINSIFLNNSQSGKSSQQKSKNQKASNQENPISRKGEVSKLVAATFVGGLVLGFKLLSEIFVDGEWSFDFIDDNVDSFIEKSDNKKNLNKNKSNKNAFRKIGAFIALTAAVISGFAILYTLFNAPKIAYKSKVNTFVKSKEMDVYIKSNLAEKEIYQQLADKAQNASGQDKEALKKQYAKMVLAKNKVPDFIKNQNRK